jgi:protein-arginine deiminase
MRRVTWAVAMTALSTACGGGDAPSGPGGNLADEKGIVADIRADSNRDGEVRFDDDSDADKLAWNASVGAVFLANIDDDAERCKRVKSDIELAACNDASDSVVNGPDDALDLAPIKIRPWAKAPADATATVHVASPAREHVRLFLRIGDGATDFVELAEDEVLYAEEIRAGVELAIEAKDIVRDPAVWDGFATVELEVRAEGETASDSVKLRVAPVLTFHHLLPAEKVFVTNNFRPGNQEMRSDLAAACSEAGLGAPEEISDFDPWTQDFFETGYMSMPSKGGTQHTMNVAYRSANVYEPQSKTAPLRPAGKYVFTHMRGKDFAGVQQFDPKHSQRMDSLNSFGNYETIPPYSHGGESYPFGRVLRGRTSSFYPDPTFTTMLDAQGMQPPVDLDTSWLFVSHVDETVSFIKAQSPRGWVLLVNDPTMAKKMLEDASRAGHGDVPMFIDKSWFDEDGNASPAQVTVDEVLADTDVMSASAEAASEIATQLAILKRETGITDAEIVKIPFLHMSYDGQSVAQQPGLVNGVYIADGHFVAPDPHGPMIEGKDILKEAMVAAVAPYGVKVHFAEDWDDYHAALGEVHCGTNTLRKIPDTLWWESGR